MQLSADVAQKVVARDVK